MENHLGRNPFNKAKKASGKSRSKFTASEKVPTLEWLLIDLPAKALMFVLKAGVQLITAIEKRTEF